jgi:hypothetical protein
VIGIDAYTSAGVHKGPNRAALRGLALRWGTCKSVQFYHCLPRTELKNLDVDPPSHSQMLLWGADFVLRGSDLVLPGSLSSDKYQFMG